MNMVEGGLEARASDVAEDRLIDRARQGEAVAWEALVQTHQEHVFRLAYLTLGDAAEAEDMAQEAFLRACLALDRFETGRPFRPWLTRIVVNLARNRRRSIGRYLQQLRRSAASKPEAAGGRGGLEEVVANRQQAELLWTAVQRLGRAKQEVIYLRFFLGMAEAEMAEALAVRPGTVKSRLHRALAELRRIVAVDFPELRELLGEG